MTFGTTEGKSWVEALPSGRATFTGRTFSRFHMSDSGGSTPTVGEIWATSDHSVGSHAHDAEELLYVLSGVIEINGRTLGPNEIVFIPSGTSYDARVQAMKAPAFCGLNCRLPPGSVGSQSMRREFGTDR